MTARERELILKVADEVRAADRSSVDREAERLIRSEVAAQPNAAYILTQRVIVQGLALKEAQARVDELEGRLRQAGLPGGRDAGPGGAPQAAAPQASGGSGVGDFLRTAAAAAAGTIGGQLIYDGVRNWAGGHGAGGPLSGGAGRAEAGDRDRGGRDAGPGEARNAEDAGGGDWGNADEGKGDSGGGEWSAAEERQGEEGGGGDWGGAEEAGGADGGGDWAADGGGSDGGGSW
jgi:hypothetical protein